MNKRQEVLEERVIILEERIGNLQEQLESLPAALSRVIEQTLIPLIQQTLLCPPHQGLNSYQNESPAGEFQIISVNLIDKSKPKCKPKMFDPKIPEIEVKPSFNENEKKQNFTLMEKTKREISQGNDN